MSTGPFLLVSAALLLFRARQRFWPAIIRTAFSVQGVVGLIKSGPVTLRGAVAMIVSCVTFLALIPFAFSPIADLAHLKKNMQIFQVVNDLVMGN